MSEGEGGGIDWMHRWPSLWVEAHDAHGIGVLVSLLETVVRAPLRVLRVPRGHQVRVPIEPPDWRECWRDRQAWPADGYDIH